MNKFFTLSLIIPCYNEASRLPSSDFISFAEENPGYNICFVNDGSTDNTAELLAALVKQHPENMSLISYAENKGKAEAVRTGINTILNSEQKTDYIGFWDADLSTPLCEVRKFIDVLNTQYDIDIVVGSRWQHLGAKIQRKTFRGLAAKFVSIIISKYLSIPIYDSQCGAKIFRSKDAILIFQDEFVSRWLFDVEIFKRTMIINSVCYPEEHIYELPVSQWIEMGNSKLKFYHIFKILSELIRIFSYYRKYGQTT